MSSAKGIHSWSPPGGLLKLFTSHQSVWKIEGGLLMNKAHHSGDVKTILVGGYSATVYMISTCLLSRTPVLDLW